MVSGATWCTSEPTASMTPAPSWPSTHGVPAGSAPVACDRSEWHTPLAAMRTRTWSGARGARVMSST